MAQQFPGPGHPVVAQPMAAPSPPGWLRPLLIFSCACAPGGFLFLIALATESNINLDKPVWFILAAAGGVGGYFASKRAAG